jgi:hypothetical protein
MSFKAELAGVAKDRLAVALHVFVESDARPDLGGLPGATFVVI